MDRRAGGVCKGVAVSAGTGTGYRGMFWASDSGAGDGRKSGEERRGLGDVSDASESDREGKGVIWKR